MTQWSQCRQYDFIRRLRKLGFLGPYSGGQYQYMVYQQYRLAVPSNTEYSVSQLRVIIQEIERIIVRRISVKDWSRLGRDK